MSTASSVRSFSGLGTPSTPFGPPETIPTRPTSFGSQPNSWGSLEAAIQSMDIKTPDFKPEIPQPGKFAIGTDRQTSINNFKAPIGAQIKHLESVLQQFSVNPANAESSQAAESVAAKVVPSKSEQLDNVLNKAETVTTSVKKQSKDIFGALSDLWKESIGFKYISPEQEKKNDEKKAKDAAKNANKKSFYDQMRSAKLAWESFMSKMMAELADRLGVGGKSLAEQNALLGIKGRNFSYKGVQSAYHIKAMHDAMVDQMNEQKRAQAKQSAQPQSKDGKTTAQDNFMNRNTSLSRQGQSAYSAAG